MAVPSGRYLRDDVSADARKPSASAYTPSQMDVAQLRQLVGMTAAYAEARSFGTSTNTVSQVDAGTTLRLEPHLRERSVE
jgi:hypothetical protein